MHWFEMRAKTLADLARWFEGGGGNPSPFPLPSSRPSCPFPFPFPPFPSPEIFLFPPCPFPSPLSSSPPLNPARGPGERCKLHSGVGADSFEPRNRAIWWQQFCFFSCGQNMDLCQKRSVLNLWDSLLCLVIPIDRTLISVRSSVSTKALRRPAQYGHCIVQRARRRRWWRENMMTVIFVRPGAWYFKGIFRTARPLLSHPLFFFPISAFFLANAAGVVVSIRSSSGVGSGHSAGGTRILAHF